MASSSSLILAFCLLTLHTLNVSGDTIESLCAKTDKPAVCSSIVQSDPRHGNVNSPIVMAEVLISAGQLKGKDAWQFMDQNFQAAKPDSELQHAFDKCTTTIVEQQLNFQPEIKKLGAKSSEVIDWLEAVQSVTSTYCKLYKPTPMPPLLTTMFQKVDDYCAALNIAQQILKAT